MLPHSSLYRISLRFILPAAAFLFSAIAGISVAAWIDAPNSPPNYGVSPLAQEDFRPMNLGTTAQTKNGSIAIVGTLIATSTTPTSFPNFPGEVVASVFRDSENSSYSLDLASSGESGLIKGRIGIGATSTQAKLTINNPATSGKTGSLSDAIYAYADNSTYGMSTVLSLEQGSPTSYALYSSGGLNYFGGNVGIGINTPSGRLHVSAKNYQLITSGNPGHDTPRCACDTNNDIQECPVSFATTDALGSICHDQYKQTILLFDVNYSSEFQVVEKGLVVKESGNVGIGTTNPTQKLAVDGTIRSLSGGFMFPDGTTQATAAPWYASGNTIFNTNTGNVGVGTTVPSQKLDVAGNLRVQGAIIGNMDNEQHFVLNHSTTCGPGATPGYGGCYPNEVTADKACRARGYLYSTYFTSASDCCGGCANWLGDHWSEWDCGSGGDSYWIVDLFCVR